MAVLKHIWSGRHESTGGRPAQQLQFAMPAAIRPDLAASQVPDGLPTLSLELISFNFVLAIGLYFISGLVSPDFEGGEGFDMREIHRRERRTYLGFYILLMILGVAMNFQAAPRFGLASWGLQNLVAFPLLLAGLGGFFVDRRWMQIAAPLVVVVCLFICPNVFYPTLQ